MREGRSRWPQESSYGASRGGRWKERERSRARQSSRSASPDLDLAQFLADQQAARPRSPKSEAARLERLAAGGAMRIKSRHQKEKEEQERKRREADEEAARAYQDFVQDMEGRPSSERARGVFVRAGGSSTYQPSSRELHQTSFAAPSSSSSTMEEGREEAQAATAVARLRRDPLGKKRGAMGDFLGELQREQAKREHQQLLRQEQQHRAPYASPPEGSRYGSQKDTDDPHSTNVCVINLPANINEIGLGQYFAKWGDVATVKIMWPRGEEFLPGTATGARSTLGAGLTGFVSYMTRSDAESALDGADGLRWNGVRLRTSWGRSMLLPARPAFVSSNSAQKDEALSRRVKRGSRSPDSRNHRRRRGGTSRSPTTWLRTAVEESSNDGPETERRVRLLAQRIKEYGRAIEEQAKWHQSGNPQYAFLFDDQSAAHQYMRILIDERHEPTIGESAFADEGTASLYSSDSEEDSEWEKLQERGKQHVLGKAARRRFEAMLRSMTLRRERIARAMAFAIEHASAAVTISDILIDSLIQPGTPLARKQARLYIVSDILHNSAATASHAWRYRSLFETRMARVFAHLGDVARSFSGRIKRETSKDWARTLLAVWESWLAFPQQTLAEWGCLLETGSARETGNDDAQKQQGDIGHPYGVAGDAVAAAQEQVRRNDGSHGEEEENGENTDGEAMKGVDGDAGDIDGQEMQEGEEDIDGQEMQEDTEEREAKQIGGFMQ